MKKLIFILILSISFYACGTKEKKEMTYGVVENSVFEGTRTIDPSSMIEFSDPARMAGSNFGDFFVSMIRTQNYDMALKFTSKSSIEKFGLSKVKEKYESFKYNYTLEQKSLIKNDSVYIIAYATSENATGRLKRMTVVVENDSCKLVLPDNLEDFLK